MSTVSPRPESLPPGLVVYAATSTGFVAFIFGLIFAAALSLPRLTDYGKQVAAWGRAQFARSPLADRLSSEPVDADQLTSGLVDTVPVDGLSRPTVAAPLSPAELLVAKDGRPPPAGQAWSSYTGRWHLVTVGPPEMAARGRPIELAAGAYYTVFFTVPCALLGLFQVKGLEGAALAGAPAALFVLLGAAFWFPRYRRRLGFARQIVYRGQVVKLWLRSNPRNSEAPSLRCCCVDDGESEVARTFHLKQRTYKSLHVGDLVQVTYSPRWQLLRRIRRVRRS